MGEYIKLSDIASGLTRTGTELNGTCPYAPGRGKSFYFKPSTPSGDCGPFNCFSCGAHGYVHGGVFVLKGDRLPAGVVRAERPAVLAPPGLVPDLVSSALAGAFAVMQGLYAGSEAERYIASRRLGPVTGAGYLPGARYQFPGSVDREVLARVGLLRPDGRTAPWWQHRVVLPYSWVDPDGQERITHLYGRSLLPPDPKRENHLYTRGTLNAEAGAWKEGPLRGDLSDLPSWFRGLFNPRALEADSPMFVEAGLDALGAMRLGMGAVAAFGGTSNYAPLRECVLRPDAVVRWGLDNDKAWARERSDTECKRLDAELSAASRRHAPDSAEVTRVRRSLDAARNLPRESIWSKYKTALGSRLVEQLPPRLDDGCKDWADICARVFDPEWIKRHPEVRLVERPAEVQSKVAHTHSPAATPDPIDIQGADPETELCRLLGGGDIVPSTSATRRTSGGIRR